MIVIGMTGGIGSGKSSVCDYLKTKYGAFIQMADDIGHQVMAPGGCAYEPLKELLGDGYFLPDMTFDRKKIGDRAFKEPELLEKMNKIIHPAVHQTIIDGVLNAKKEGVEIAVIEAALLIEANYRDVCDEYWFVYTNKESRYKRLLSSRDITAEKIEDVMSRQLSEEYFRKECEYTLDNSYDFDNTARQIDERIEFLRGNK